MVDKLASDVISRLCRQATFQSRESRKASKIVNNAEVVLERLKVSTEQ
jgi:hypothetical protein